jgi:hypothetical protein
MLYASLDFTEAHLGSGTTSDTVDKAKLLRFLRTVSRRIDALMDPIAKRQMFAPLVESRPQRVTPMAVNSFDGTLRVDGPLLALDSVVLGASALSAVEAWPASVTPVRYLRLTGCCDSWYSDPACTENGGPLLVTIAGTWGIHRDWANAWQRIDTLAAAVTDTTTETFTVADADGVDAYGVAPRLSVGDLLRMDSEYREVTAVNTTTNVVTARRGSHGTTAATHQINTPIYRFEVEDEIKYATARQAGLLYSRIGAYTTVEITPMGEIRYPADLLTELKAILSEYNYG